MLGNKMEALPPLPQKVLDIAGKVQRVNTLGLSTGAGVAFGASISVEKGFEFTPVYAHLAIGAGFDVLLAKFNGIGCANTSDGKLGMNGWYAQGQAYAYLQGSMGIKFKRSKFDILNVAMAAIIEAKAPNPIWLSGNISAKYKILGGLVKGSARLDFEVGEQCDMVATGSPLGDISFIGDIKPGEDEGEVNVFAMPQVAFNTAINEEFEVEGFGGGTTKYRVLLDEVSLTAEKSGVVSGTGSVSGFEFNAEKDVLALSTRDLLPGEEKLTLTVAVHVEQYTDNAWSPLKNEDGSPMTERREVRFTTGARPDNIPDDCVVYSYPQPNQFNFHKSEYPQGYIKLNRNLDYLFATESGGKKYQVMARFTSGKSVVESAVSYSDMQVNIAIPQNLNLAGVYKMNIVRAEVAESTEADRNVQRTEVAMEGEGDATMQQNTLTATIGGAGEKIVYATAFRTSRYATFKEKAAAAPTPTPMYAVHSDTKSSLIAIDFNMEESYDQYEVNGMEVENFAMIQPEALGQEGWIKSYAGSKLYNLPGAGATYLPQRVTAGMGDVPLKKSVYIDDLNQRRILNEGDLQRTTIDGHQGHVRIAYFVPHFVQLDYSNARTYAANRYQNTEFPAALSHLINGESLRDIDQDYYTLRLNYVLPGKTEPNSYYDYSIDYHIR
jgi:hypothetical protein